MALPLRSRVWAPVSFRPSRGWVPVSPLLSPLGALVLSEHRRAWVLVASLLQQAWALVASLLQQVWAMAAY